MGVIFENPHVNILRGFSHKTISNKEDMVLNQIFRINLNEIPKIDPNSQNLLGRASKEILNLNQLIISNAIDAKYQFYNSGFIIDSSPLERYYIGNIEIRNGYFNTTNESKFISSTQYDFLGYRTTGYFHNTSDKSKTGKASFYYFGLNHTLNEYAQSEYLKTDFGDVKVFLDLYDNNDAFDRGSLPDIALLFNFDSNKDGLLNADDKFFDKLKVKGYDKDGNEKIAKLSDVVKYVDLEKFISKDHKEHLKEYLDKYLTGELKILSPFFKPLMDDYFDKRMINETSNPYNLFINAEYRYKRVEDKDVNEFFHNYADEDGWVDLRANNNIFDNFNNFAYVKQGLDDDFRLSEFNSIKSKDDLNMGEYKYIQYQKNNLLKFYDDYQEAKKEHLELINELKNIENPTDEMKALINNADLGSTKMMAMQNDFTKNTGIEFSEKNLESLKSMFDKNEKKAAYAMNDTDSVVAMKLNKTGTITLKFDSGREITVNELYNDIGKINTINGKRVSVNLKVKTMSDEELNALDFHKIGVILDKDGKDDLVSLKDLGVTAIKSFGKKGFLLFLGDNKTMSTKDMFNIMFLDDKTNKNNKEIKEEDKFYRKIDVTV